MYALYGIYLRRLHLLRRVQRQAPWTHLAKMPTWIRTTPPPSWPRQPLLAALGPLYVAMPR